jgi:hypothetical protein
MALPETDELEKLAKDVQDMGAGANQRFAAAQIRAAGHQNITQTRIAGSLDELGEALSASTGEIKEGSERLALTLDAHKAAIEKLNADTADLYNRLYGRLNTLTYRMMIASIVSCVALVIQVIFQIVWQLTHKPG